MTKTRSAIVVLALALFIAPLLAHEVTYKGTVISVEKTSLKVTVVDPKTKRPGPMSFDFDKDTKVFRGDKRVSMDQAAIQKGENVAVTIDHDADETLAISIKLDAKK